MRNLSIARNSKRKATANLSACEFELYFEILHKGEAYQTEIGIVGRDAGILVQSAQPTVEIDETAWHQLLKTAAGEALFSFPK